jgi:hypothetical protein
VHFLLAAKSFSGITTSELDEFKSVYGPFAYHCRFPGCSDASTCFSTDGLRLRHENTHVPSLVCTFSDCTYSLAFQSVSGLERHIRENHVSEASRIPGSIRIHSKHSSVQASFRTASKYQPDTKGSTRTDLDQRSTNLVGNFSSDDAPPARKARKRTTAELAADIQRYRRAGDEWQASKTADTVGGEDNSFSGTLQPEGDAEQASRASNRRYQCYYCRESEPRTIQDLIIHESRDHSPLTASQTVRCTFCYAQLRFLEYERHLQHYHGENLDADIYRDHITKDNSIWLCMWCHHLIHTLRNLFSHEWECHKFYESYGGARECSFCPMQMGTDVRSSVEYQDHLQKAHAEEPVASLYLRHLEGLEARTWKQRSVGTSQSTATDQRTIATNQRTIATDQRTYRCNWCVESPNAYHPTLISLMKHESSDHSFQQLFSSLGGNCMICSWERTITLVASPMAYLEHLEASHARTAHASSYIDHLRTLNTEIVKLGVGNRDSNGLTYFCNWCVSRAGQFDSLQDLIVHEETHQGTVNKMSLCYGICNFCPLRLNSQATEVLIEHLRKEHRYSLVTSSTLGHYLPHLLRLLGLLY